MWDFRLIFHVQTSLFDCLIFRIGQFYYQLWLTLQACREIYPVQYASHLNSPLFNFLVTVQIHQRLSKHGKFH